MEPDRAQRVMDLYLDTSELAPSDRAAFLRERCGTDHALHEEIAALLRSRTDEPDFLAEPIFRIGAELLVEAAEGALRPGDRLGDCVIESLLGMGGMGEVYLARDTVLGRPVAVKLIQRGRGSDLLRHFRHERQVLAGLNHPHIARLYGGAVTPEGQAYLVMEYIEGESLDAYCRERRLSVADRLALFRKVCAGVSHAHRHLVIHRDLKPANIRVTLEGEPKLLDFGIAKLIEPEGTAHPGNAVTLSGAMTPEYASPEQLRGETITTASDVYSLGVVLYELLTGQRAYGFAGSRPDQLTRAVCEQDPPRPSTVAGTHPSATGDAGDGEPPGKLRRLLAGDLDNIVAMAMRKEPQRRYTSVAQFSEDIRRHCAGLPVFARKDTLGYRADKFVRRNKFFVAATALVLLLLVGGLVATGIQRDRARLAQAQAERLNAFLQTLLGSANPESGPGRDLKVVQVLDEASRKLDSELGGEPALLAQAHLTIGQAYAGLKEAAPAIRHLRTAVEINHLLSGDGSMNTAHAQAMLGLALESLARQHDEAEPLLRAALAIDRQHPEGARQDLPLILDALSGVMISRNRFNEAQTLAQESLAFSRRSDGELSQPYARRLENIGVLKMNLHDHAGAEVLFRQSVAIYRRLDVRKAAFADVLTRLSYDLILQGRLDEAEPFLYEAQDCYLRTTGSENIAYYFDLGLLALIHFLREDYPTAEREMRECHAHSLALVPPDDEDVVGGKVVLGLALTRQGKAAEGEPYLRDSLKIAKANHFTGGMTAPSYVEAALGECLITQGRYAEAEPLLLEGYDSLKASLGAQNPATVRAGDTLRNLYAVWQKPVAASP